MTGTIVRHQPKRGKPTFGFSYYSHKDENGKWVRRVKRGFRTKDEAEKALRQAVEDHERKPAAERTIPTFAETFTRWHKEVIAQNWSPKSVERYGELSKYAIGLFGDQPLDQLNSYDLTVAVNQLRDHGGRVTKEHPQGRPLAAKTTRHIFFLIKGVFSQAVDWDLIAKNPMAKMKAPKVPKRRPKIVAREGFNALLRRTHGTRLYPVILLGASTGMRRGELLAVEWSDLNWDGATLEVSKSLEETKAGLRIKSTKSGETRRFALPVKVIEALREHQQVQQKDREMYGADYHNLNLIFARPDGYYYNPDKLGTRIAAAMRTAGLSGVSLHSLRHTHASELLSQGAPITAVAERLGHASPNITLSIYSHALPADNQAAAKLWNDAMADVIEESRTQVKSGVAPNNTTKPSRKPLTLIKSAS